MLNLFSSPTVTFCEKIGTGLISRPYAALSNIPYFIVALLIYKMGKNSKILKVFSFVILIVATFSLIYDVKSIYLSQIFDLTGMLILIDYLLYLDISKLLSVHNRFSLKKTSLILILMILTVTAILLIVSFKGVAGNIVFGSFVLFDVYIQDLLYRKKLNHHYKYWVWAFLIFAFGFVLWIPDLTKSICAPSALLNGRPLFHYAVSISLYLLAIFYLKNAETA